MENGLRPGQSTHHARVTLGDFKALQEQLLLVKQQAYEAREREASAKVALEKALRYPAELNPFGHAPTRRDAAVQTDTAVHSESEPEWLTAASIDALQQQHNGGLIFSQRRRAAERALECRRRALLRLVFHGWRAAHVNSALLRSMSQMASQVIRGDMSAVGLQSMPEEASVFKDCLRSELSSLELELTALRSHVRSFAAQLHRFCDE